MTESNDHLIDWLRDAYAMEQQAETMLTAMSERIEHYPDIRARISEHIRETRRQADMLRGCIERRGGDVSTIKNMAARAMAAAQGLGGMFASDEIVKGAMASYTFEHMEIASYRCLIAAADEVGDVETSRVCAEILREEQAMAEWVFEHLPEVTRAFLARSETAGAEAKV